MGYICIYILYEYLCINLKSITDQYYNLLILKIASWPSIINWSCDYIRFLDLLPKHSFG